MSAHLLWAFFVQAAQAATKLSRPPEPLDKQVSACCGPNDTDEAAPVDILMFEVPAGGPPAPDEPSALRTVATVGAMLWYPPGPANSRDWSWCVERLLEETGLTRVQGTRQTPILRAVS